MVDDESTASNDPAGQGAGSSDQANLTGESGGSGGGGTGPVTAAAPARAAINLGAPQSSNSSTLPTKDPYNPEIVNDRTRTWIALTLLGITGVMVLVTFIMTAWALFPGAADTNLKAILAIVNVTFGPIIALLGSVIGFYFGSRAAAGNLAGK